MKKFPYRHILYLFVFFIILTRAAFADKINTSAEGLALKGYDVVAYFTEKKAVLGSGTFKSQWNGATWHFSSAENKTKFEENPLAYVPQYGGFCAYAVSRGSLADTDPNTFDIVNGKLYLNINKTVQDYWKRNISGHIYKANGEWLRLNK